MILFPPSFKKVSVSSCKIRDTNFLKTSRFYARSQTRLGGFTFTFMDWRRKWQPTPVFLPGESQGTGEPGGLPSKESQRVGQRICLQCGRPGFYPWVGKIPWRRERLPTSVLWPGEFHGLCSPWGRIILGLVFRIPLQYSCLENPMDG